MAIQIKAAQRLIATKLNAPTCYTFATDLGVKPVSKKPPINEDGCLWFYLKDDLATAKKNIEAKLGVKAKKGNEPSSYFWSFDIDDDMKILKLRSWVNRVTKEKMVVLEFKDGSGHTPWVFDNVYKPK